MARNLFIWILIILLLITGTLLGLELYGQDKFKPSLRFGTDKNPDIIALIDGQKNLSDQISALETKIGPTGSSSLPTSSLPKSTGTDSTGTDSNQTSTNQPQTNNSTVPSLPTGVATDPNQSTQTPSSNQATGQNILFTNCVGQNGRDEAGFTATLKSNVCTLSGLNIRPDSFVLNAETLEYQEGVTTGGKLKNTQSEVFNFTGSDNLFFTPETSKAGDKFKVSATVKNQNGVYIFQTFTKVEKVI